MTMTVIWTGMVLVSILCSLATGRGPEVAAAAVAAVAAELGIPAEKSLLLQHLILSHHGKPEHGAAVIPKCAEATLLTYIDGIDGRMEIYREQLLNIKPGEFSGRLFALDGGMIYRHF